MSQHFSWQAAVTKSDLEPSTKLVLLVIGTHMNMHGSGAFPSYRTIAEGTSLNRITVIRHVEIAVSKGWLTKEARFRSGAEGKVESDSNLYAICFPVVAQDNQGGSAAQPPLVAQDNHPSCTAQPGVVAQCNPNTPALTPQVTQPPSPGGDEGKDLLGGEGNKAPKPARKVSDLETPKFAEFYEVYPRHEARPEAAKAWRKNNCEAQADRIIAEVKARAADDPQWAKDRKRFIPLPATYLNGRRWEDRWRADAAASGGAASDADMPEWMRGAI